MRDIKLCEGNISFTFKKVYFAVQYDEWNHFKNVYQKACGGSKAVDFIVRIDHTLWMIEVKDFRRHRRTKEIPLYDEITKKVRDTMAGLISAKFHASDDEERRCARSASECTKLRVGVHIEQPRKPSRLFPNSVNLVNFTIKLKQQLKFADCHPKVFDILTFPRELGNAVGI